MNKYVIKKVIVVSAVFVFLLFGLPKAIGDMRNHLYDREVNIAIQEKGLDRKAAEEYVNKDRNKRAEESRKNRKETWIFPIFIYN